MEGGFAGLRPPGGGRAQSKLTFGFRRSQFCQKDLPLIPNAGRLVWPGPIAAARRGSCARVRRMAGARVRRGRISYRTAATDRRGGRQQRVSEGSFFHRNDDN